MSVTEAAPAKINLALHVTGRRADGYHLLDSLVVFTALGDRVTIEPDGTGPHLEITGPFAGALPVTEDNLCLRAARAIGGTGTITLEKHLPIASGIGGGSADAAAVLRAYGVRPAHPEALGADVPVCLAARPARMRGVGELLDDVPPLPVLPLVLVNPGVAVATPTVFAALGCTDNPPLPDLPAGGALTRAALLDWLAGTRNDLEPPALALAPVIATALDALRGAGAAFARMSGSGATCFGIFTDAAAAETARARIAAAHPGWWVAATETLAGAGPAA